MIKPLVKFLASSAMLATMCVTAYGASSSDKVLLIYNWSDYMPADILRDFEKESGIKIVYDVFDSNEVLEAKLFAGNTGFDIVVPSASPFLARQIKAGVYHPLDKSKLSNYKNLDKNLLEKLAHADPDNQYGIPYMWGTTGIGYNVDKVAAALGKNVTLDSWDILFKPENIAKLKQCGVAILDAPSEVLSIALNYLGKDPNSTNVDDYQNDAQKLLMGMRPYVTYFHSSQYINDLANGDICIALGWSGDVLQAAKRAKESGKGVKVNYVLPKEGTVIFIDTMVIPKDSEHIDNAYTFFDYMMRPDVIAKASNYLSYANGNAASLPLVSPAIRNNPNIYPPAGINEKLYSMNIMPPRVERIMTRTWITIKTGH